MNKLNGMNGLNIENLNECCEYFETKYCTTILYDQICHD